MSVEEMKLEAINRITKLDDEQAIKDVLEQLQKIDDKKKSMPDLAKHYDELKEQYGNVLDKLAK